MLGRNLLRQWLLRPSLSLSTIKSRHDAVACFVHPENITTADLLHQHLAKIRNVPRILTTMKTGRHKVKDWQGLVVVCFELNFLANLTLELLVFFPCSDDSRRPRRAQSTRRRRNRQEGNFIVNVLCLFDYWPNLKLMDVLDVGMFRDLGAAINDTVRAFSMW
jgi:hypothetical protein